MARSNLRRNRATGCPAPVPGEARDRPGTLRDGSERGLILSSRSRGRPCGPRVFRDRRTVAPCLGDLDGGVRQGRANLSHGHFPDGPLLAFLGLVVALAESAG